MDISVFGCSGPSRLAGSRRPGLIHQNAAHKPGAHSEEVGSILPLDPLDIDQPEVGLVYLLSCGRLAIGHICRADRSGGSQRRAGCSSPTPMLAHNIYYAVLRLVAKSRIREKN